MRASETLLNEAAWKEPPLRSAGRTVARRTDLRSRLAGRTDADARARSLGLLCEAQKALDPDYGHNIAAAGRTARRWPRRRGWGCEPPTAPVLYTHTGEWGWMGQREGGREGGKERAG